MELLRCANAEEAARRAGGLLVRAAVTGADIVLAGGSTPMRAYEIASGFDLDWTGVDLWYGDERCVAYDHEDSNHGQATKRLDAPGATWHPMPGTSGPDAGARAYAEELAGVRAFDLVLLGMGPDGHTLSLFPDAEQLDAPDRVTGVRDSPKPPPERITLTLAALDGAALVLMVTGAEKADALARVLAGPDRGAPASLLPRERLTIIADAAALEHHG